MFSGPAYDVEVKKAWAQASVPFYVDCDFRILRHGKESVRAFDMDAREFVVLRREDISLCSWLMLRANDEGAIVTVKLRCDDVATNRL